MNLVLQTVLAALGGMLLGVGLGVLIGSRRRRSSRPDDERIESVVLPYLKRQARLAGLGEGPADGRAPAALAVSLAEALQQKRPEVSLPFDETMNVHTADIVDAPERDGLPFDDTMDVNSADLAGTKR